LKQKKKIKIKIKRLNLFFFKYISEKMLWWYCSALMGIIFGLIGFVFYLNPYVRLFLYKIKHGKDFEIAFVPYTGYLGLLRKSYRNLGDSTAFLR
jgi:hypothetical protein